MCDPVSLALMAAGTGLTTIAQGQAEKRQASAAQAAQQRQQAAQQRAAAVVDQLLGEFTPQSQARHEGAGARQVEEGITTALDASRDVVPVGEQRFQGRVSDDFLRTSAERTREELDRSAKIARLLGKIGGATRGRQTQGYAQADANTDVGLISNFARGDAHVDQGRIQRAGRVDPLLAGAGALLSGAGAGGVGGGVGGGAQATPTLAAGASMSGPEFFTNYPRVRPTALR